MLEQVLIKFFLPYKLKMCQEQTEDVVEKRVRYYEPIHTVNNNNICVKNICIS